MSGHSKWSTIKRKKGANDAKRGQLFTRITREIVIAAREGGGDPDSNIRLRLVLDKARAANMPKDNIARAVKRGTGEDKDAAAIEEVTYEGYGPHGVALVMEVVTDNRNRAVADIRHVLNRYGGSLGENGSVAWQFSRQAYFAFPNEGVNFDEIFEIAVEAGADDIVDDGELIEVTGDATAFREISEGLTAAGIRLEASELRMVPNHELDLDLEDTIKVMRVIEALEELDDINNVFSNLSISDEALMQLEAAA